MRRLLITGGTGYLGGELVRLAAAAGWDVRASYLTTEPPAGRSHWVRLDVTDPVAVRDLVAAVQPDAVIHTAYRRDGPAAEAVTVGGAGTVAAAAHEAGARLIHLSTDVIFDGERSGAYTETDAAHPVSAYGRAKLAAERAVLAAEPHALVARTSLLYGGATPGAPEEAALAAAQGEDAGVFFTDEIRCPTQVGDLAAALLELTGLDVAGPLHLAGAEPLTRYDFACLIAAAAGLPTDRIRAGSTTDFPTPRPRNCTLDSTRATRLVTAQLRGPREVLTAGASFR
jgi:dTDP-4-dehydrorhamnose reductase